MRRGGVGSWGAGGGWDGMGWDEMGWDGTGLAHLALAHLALALNLCHAAQVEPLLHTGEPCLLRTPRW